MYAVSLQTLSISCHQSCQYFPSGRRLSISGDLRDSRPDQSHTDRRAKLHVCVATNSEETSSSTVRRRRAYILSGQTQPSRVQTAVVCKTSSHERHRSTASCCCHCCHYWRRQCEAVNSLLPVSVESRCRTSPQQSVRWRRGRSTDCRS